MAKSDLHIELARKALIWLEGRSTQRGIRGCEEVIIGDGYVADSAAISGLTFANEKLFLGDQYKNRISGNGGWGLTDDYVFVFESKVSRPDFFNTFKRCNHLGDRLEAVSNYHFVITPKGMISPDDVPSFWGLLEASRGGLKLSKLPVYKNIGLEKLHEMSYKILRSSKGSKFTVFTDLINDYRLLNSEQNVQECDATDDDSSTEAGKIK